MIETANHYLHKTSHIKRTYGMRYLPSESIHSNQFGWHHDMEDRQLKLMILPSDVEEDDQYMTYIRGSHNAFHSYPHFLKNTLDFELVGATPKWKRTRNRAPRARPSWADSLEDPSIWL